MSARAMSARAMSARPAGAAPLNPVRWALLRGRVAAALGKPLDANPHDADSAEAWAWAKGHGAWREGVGRRGRLGSADKAGTLKVLAPKVGRGRSILGRRREWSNQEKAVLAACRGGGGDFSNEEIAALLGRSHQAVRNQRTAMDKEAR